MAFRAISNPRTLHIDVRVNREEKDLIEANADAAKIQVNDYMRKCALKKRLTSRYEIHKINTLRSLVDAIRDVVPASDGELKDSLRDLLQRAAVAIDSL